MQNIEIIEDLNSTTLKKKVNAFMAIKDVISVQYQAYKENGGERTILSCMVHYKERKIGMVHHKERKSGLPMSAYDGEIE